MSPTNVHSVNKIDFKKSNYNVKNGFNKAKFDVGQVFKCFRCSNSTHKANEC